MTKPTRFLILLTALATAGISLQAQPALKVVTVDLNRAYQEYWKTQQQIGKLIEEKNSVQEQVKEMERRLETIVTEAKKLDLDSQNPALSKEAQARLAGEAQEKMREFQVMKEQFGQGIDNAERQLSIRQKNIAQLMIDEITAIVLEMGKARGSTFIVDVSGRTMNGVSSILFADPGYDITNEVITRLNESKPADFKPPATTPEAPAP